VREAEADAANGEERRDDASYVLTTFEYRWDENQNNNSFSFIEPGNPFGVANFPRALSSSLYNNSLTA
jgi:hypothetical protein